jgi:hypothetical protein
MQVTVNVPLAIGALLSAVAALLHVAIIAGGPAWYRFFGAGKRLTTAAAAGEWYPAVVTMAITAVLGSWSAYALAGAGVIAPLPFLKAVLVLVTAIYILRGLAFAPVVLATGGKLTPFVA